MELHGKVALVTGGTKGIGAATAMELAGQGADVAILGRNDTPGARETLSRIESKGCRAHLILADVADPDAATRAVRETIGVLGGLDVLVHCAGGGFVGNIIDMDPADWYRLFDVHVHAALHLCRATLPHMREKREGAVVLVSSVAAHRGVPNIVPYGVVKGALLQFTRGLARENADYNIRVNCVSPGIVITDFHAAMTPEQARHNLDNRIPLHRFGTPAQVAEVISLLVRNDFITGENYMIDGGMTMRMV